MLRKAFKKSIFFIAILPFFVFANSAEQIKNINEAINIIADQQKIDLQNNTITFIGNVIILHQELTLKADKVIVKDIQNKNQQSLNAFGNPANFKVINQKEAKQNINGNAQEISYQLSSNLIKLKGSAEVFQQDNHILSDHIVYSLDDKTVSAFADGRGRVKTTLSTTKFKEKN